MLVCAADMPFVTAPGAAGRRRARRSRPACVGRAAGRLQPLRPMRPRRWRSCARRGARAATATVWALGPCHIESGRRDAVSVDPPAALERERGSSPPPLPQQGDQLRRCGGPRGRCRPAASPRRAVRPARAAPTRRARPRAPPARSSPARGRAGRAGRALTVGVDHVRQLVDVLRRRGGRCHHRTSRPPSEDSAMTRSRQAQATSPRVRLGDRGASAPP